jgi:hypothetical protein
VARDDQNFSIKTLCATCLAPALTIAPLNSTFVNFLFHVTITLSLAKAQGVKKIKIVHRSLLLGKTINLTLDFSAKTYCGFLNMSINGQNWSMWDISLAYTAGGGHEILAK